MTPDDDGASSPDMAALERELDEKRSELREMHQALPAHSVRPHQLIEIEDLEERISELESRLAGGAGGEGEPPATEYAQAGE